MTCYCRTQSTIRSACNGLRPCGLPSSTGFVQCCRNEDTCGADGFCHFKRVVDESSGYYMGGCTDPTFKDSSCHRTCTNHRTQDVVYSESTNLWSCCFSATLKLDCSHPSNETFQALDPVALFATPFPLLTATTGGTTSSSSPTTVPPANRPSELSIEAEAGIGVGIFLAFVIGLGLLVILSRRRSLNRHRYGYQISDGSSMIKHDKPIELPGAMRKIIELPGNNIIQHGHISNEPTA